MDVHYLRAAVFIWRRVNLEVGVEIDGDVCADLRRVVVVGVGVRKH